MVERVATVVAPRQQERGARVVGEVAGMARQRRHEEQGRAVEIAGDADERGQGRASRRLQSGQRAGAGEPHQPLGVGDRPGMGLVGIGGVRHGGLDVSDGLERDKPGGSSGQERDRRCDRRPLRLLANACNVMVILHNSRGRPIWERPAGGSPSSEHIQSINGFNFKPASPRGDSRSKRELHAHNRAGR